MKLNHSPTLMIVDNAGVILKASSDQGFPLITGNSDEISSRLGSLKNSSISNFVVVGDINPYVAGHDIQSKLLKVLEDLKIDAMFVSSRDCFSDIFLSRFVQVIKKVGVYKNNFNSRGAAVSVLKEERSFYEILPNLISEFPGYLPFVAKFKSCRVPAKAKLLDLV